MLIQPFTQRHVGTGLHSWRRARRGDALVVVDALLRPWTRDALLDALCQEDAWARRQDRGDLRWLEASLRRSAAFGQALGLLLAGPAARVTVLAGPVHTVVSVQRAGTLLGTFCLPCGSGVARPPDPLDGPGAERWWHQVRAFGADHPIHEDGTPEAPHALS